MFRIFHRFFPFLFSVIVSFKISASISNQVFRSVPVFSVSAVIICLSRPDDSVSGDKVFIPRMLLSPTDVKLPFRFQRRQFPISPCFGMTINKSQGQSLYNVGIYLPKAVFTHGQNYMLPSQG
uniref:ATP-dependent DNA helicase PIF1 n=1 Tax=Noccaea caerulescens TaxID=107243 RepID=A0A1J3IDF8_NOCCA